MQSSHRYCARRDLVWRLFVKIRCKQGEEEESGVFLWSYCQANTEEKSLSILISVLNLNKYEANAGLIFAWQDTVPC